MKKFLIVLIVVGAAVCAWWWLREAEVRVSWDFQWPEGLEATGEAVEPVLAGPEGEPTEGDWARAEERARWKAYYYAQLRMAERLGGWELSSETTLRDLALEDQVLKARYEGTIQAAAEKEEKSTVERLDDAVRAQVVVGLPPSALETLKGVVIAALEAGRISLDRRAPPASTRVAEVPDEETNGEAKRAPKPGAEGTSSTGAGGSGAAESRPGVPPPRSVAPPQHPEATGCSLYLSEGAGRLGAAPVVYDAAGSELGSSFDLPADRLAAGLPLASPSEAGTIREWAGERPWELDATVSQGNLFLEEALSAEEIGRFREFLGRGRVVLVVGTREG